MMDVYFFAMPALSAREAYSLHDPSYMDTSLAPNIFAAKYMTAAVTPLPTKRQSEPNPLRCIPQLQTSGLFKSIFIVEKICAISFFDFSVCVVLLTKSVKGIFRL